MINVPIFKKDIRKLIRQAKNNMRLCKKKAIAAARKDDFTDASYYFRRVEHWGGYIRALHEMLACLINPNVVPII